MAETVTDVATAVALGRRDRQEDAVAGRFAAEGGDGFAILSDGMGGHDDGHVAAQAIVDEVMRCLGEEAPMGGTRPRDGLQRALHLANLGLRERIDAGLGQEGMGGTLVVAVIRSDCLTWISVGDSALYLFRGGRLLRLNEVHSLAPQIDLMASRGEIDAEAARTHPQRGCLTSALVGGAINRIDSPEDAVTLIAGDIVLLASDGLEVLPERDLTALLQGMAKAPSDSIAQALMQAVAKADAQEQDNTSVVVIRPLTPAPDRRLSGATPMASPVASARSLLSAERVAGLRQGLVAYLKGRTAL